MKKMECKATSLGVDVGEFEKFIKDHLQPFIVEVELSGLIDCCKTVPLYSGFIRTDYLFNLVQVGEPQPEKEVPPIGADW